MKMDLERIGSRHRDNSHHFAAESEALDQIAKEVKIVKKCSKIEKVLNCAASQSFGCKIAISQNFFALRLKLD